MDPLDGWKFVGLAFIEADYLNWRYQKQITKSKQARKLQRVSQRESEEMQWVVSILIASELSAANCEEMQKQLRNGYHRSRISKHSEDSEKCIWSSESKAACSEHSDTECLRAAVSLKQVKMAFKSVNKKRYTFKKRKENRSSC